MIIKKIKIASEPCFLLARDLSNWIRINSKKGQFSLTPLAELIDEFVILNEDLISGKLPPTKCNEKHDCLCPKCLIDKLYLTIKDQTKNINIIKDFRKNFIS